jgi:hypothetical protein
MWNTNPHAQFKNEMGSVERMNVEHKPHAQFKNEMGLVNKTIKVDTVGSLADRHMGEHLVVRRRQEPKKRT